MEIVLTIFIIAACGDSASDNQGCQCHMDYCHHHLDVGLPHQIIRVICVILFIVIIV